MQRDSKVQGERVTRRTNEVRRIRQCAFRRKWFEEVGREGDRSAKQEGSETGAMNSRRVGGGISSLAGEREVKGEGMEVCNVNRSAK